MSAVSNGDVLQIFKKVYGDINNLVPEDYELAKLIPYTQSQRVGDVYVEAVILSNEVGQTWMGSGTDALELQAPIAGAVKQAEVRAFAQVLSSLVPFQVISRSAVAGPTAFLQATRHIIANNIKSHGKFREISRLYGQSPNLLGATSYYTGTYRGVSFTSGTGTLVSDVYGSVAFTNGVNAAQNLILFDKGTFAAAMWVGMEGVKVAQVNASGVILASGQLVSVDTALGIIKVDFSPTVATGTNLQRVAFTDSLDAKDMLGIDYILGTRGSLFGINNASFSLFRGGSFDAGQKKLSLEVLQKALAQQVNAAGMEGDVVCHVNPRSWSSLAQTEAGARRYDNSYKSAEAEQGFEKLCYYTQTGKIEVSANRYVKEGEGYIMSPETWSRSGSAPIGFNIPGLDDSRLIYPSPNQTAYIFRSYSDEYIFTAMPARNIKIIGIDDESAT